jgi:hypothetical protein
LHRFPAATSWPVSGIFLLSFLYEHDASFVFLLEERELHIHTDTHIRNSGFFWKRIGEKLGVKEMSPIHFCLLPFFLASSWQALRQGETWIGRGSFEASQRGQLLCSRRQAVIQNNGETGLRLECHGCNPLYFVVCQSANFFATQVSHLS